MVLVRLTKLCCGLRKKKRKQRLVLRILIQARPRLADMHKHLNYMFDYKDASFYTNYFNEHPLFKLTEEFKETEDEEDKNLYVGYVEVLDTIHPLILRVEIPKSFPHQHLVFRTKSLSGYPHLIHNGKIKYGDWFCLNTPFAETAKDQLDIEVVRLMEWINHQMRKDLPPNINEKDVVDALRKANIYEWENLDEVNELQVNAELTFVGDFSNDLEYFKKKVGHLHCIKTRDKRYYAFADNQFTNYEMPYVIVDEYPQNNALRDFVVLRDQYDWDDEMCKHLLPSILLSRTWQKSGENGLRFEKSKVDGFCIENRGKSALLKKYSLEEAIELIEKYNTALSEEEVYMPAQTELFSEQHSQGEKCSMRLLPRHRELIEKELNKTKEEVLKNNGYNPWDGINLGSCKSYDEMTDEELEEEAIRQQEEDYAMYIRPYEYHHFALGVLSDDKIIWFVLYTNLSVGKYDRITFDIGIKDLTISKVVSYPLLFLKPQIVDQRLFWGRGKLSDIFQQKRIALVGLGALGSIVAESLARSGVTVVGLWDNDIVEPGNICRSTYQLSDIGESKANALTRKLRLINPFIHAKEIYAHGRWHSNNGLDFSYQGGSFYDNINYANQEQSLSQIKDYDIIIDCTGSNEMLHFLSYAVPDAIIISLCITNHSNDLLCFTNKNGNPFELRRGYLSRIEQDTKNFYLEGSGCYSPTFLARNCDISSLVNLAIREINDAIDKGEVPSSLVLSHNRRGVLIDRLVSYKAEGYDIWMTISTETLLDAEEMNDVANGEIGYVFGTYSRDGKLIMVTHIVDALNARDVLEDAFKTSKGIIDYIGDYRYSGEQPNTYTDNDIETLAAKAEDESINTNNPLLAVRNPDGSVSFFLYINNGLVSLVKQS